MVDGRALHREHRRRLCRRQRHHDLAPCRRLRGRRSWSPTTSMCRPASCWSASTGATSRRRSITPRPSSRRARRRSPSSRAQVRAAAIRRSARRRPISSPRQRRRPSPRRCATLRALAQTSVGSRQDAQRTRPRIRRLRPRCCRRRPDLDAARQQLSVLEREIAEAAAAIAQAEADLADRPAQSRLHRDPLADRRLYRQPCGAGRRLCARRRLSAVGHSGARPVGRCQFQGGPARAHAAGPARDDRRRRRCRATSSTAMSLSLAPGTGAVFSVIPPENATGNFTKIVQRVPVRIALDDGDAALGDAAAGPFDHGQRRHTAARHERHRRASARPARASCPSW